MPSDAKDGLAVVPWYWRDWRASTARAIVVSNPTAGWCYRELLDASWGFDGCSLPPDDPTLAALCGVTVETWTSVKSVVLPFFKIDVDGRLYQERSRHEWQKALAYRGKCREGGDNRAARMTPARRSEIAKKAASTRWMPATQASMPATQASDACGVLAHACTLHSSPSPTRIEEGGEQSPPRVPSHGRAEAASESDRLGDKIADVLDEDVGRCRTAAAELLAAGIDYDHVVSVLVGCDTNLGVWAFKAKVLKSDEPPSSDDEFLKRSEADREELNRIAGRAHGWTPAVPLRVVRA